MNEALTTPRFTVGAMVKVSDRTHYAFGACGRVVSIAPITRDRTAPDDPFMYTIQVAGARSFGTVRASELQLQEEV